MLRMKILGITHARVTKSTRGIHRRGPLARSISRFGSNFSFFLAVNLSHMSCIRLRSILLYYLAYIECLHPPLLYVLAYKNFKVNLSDPQPSPSDHFPKKGLPFIRKFLIKCLKASVQLCNLHASLAFGLYPVPIPHILRIFGPPCSRGVGSQRRLDDLIRGFDGLSWEVSHSRVGGR